MRKDDIEHILTDPITARLDRELKALYQAPQLPPPVLQDLQRQTEDAVDDWRGTTMNSHDRSSMAWNDSFYPPTVVERRHPFWVAWGTLTALVAAIAGVSTIVHNTANVPTPIVVQIPVLEHQVASPPRVVTRIIIKKVPVVHTITRTVYIPVPTATPSANTLKIGLHTKPVAIFSLAEDSHMPFEPFSPEQGVDPVANGAISEVQNVTIAGSTIQSPAIIMQTGYGTAPDGSTDSPYAAEFKLNTAALQALGYHRLTFKYGCANGSTSGAVAALVVTDVNTGDVVRDNNTHAQLNMNPAEGHNLTSVTINFATDGLKVLQFHTEWKTGNCAVAIVGMSAAK